MQQRAVLQTLILKTDRFLEKSKDKVFASLKKAVQVNFWQTHFRNHRFKLESSKFDWENQWQNIPFFTLKDFETIGLQTRLNDAQKLIETNAKRFILGIPFRKVDRQHILCLDSIVSQKKLKKKKLGKFSDKQQRREEENLTTSSHIISKPRKNKSWRLELIDSFGLNLRQVLLSLRPKTKSKLLIIDPKIINASIHDALAEIKISSTFTDPQNLQSINDIFKDKKIQKTIKKIILTRWVKKGSNLENMDNLRNARLLVEHPFVGVSSALKHCNFIQKRHTPNAVHPKKYAIVELLNPSADGTGEIVITNLKPPELSLIRFRTGIIGKAFFQRCRCGSNWVLIINHLKKFQFKSKLLKE